MYILQSASFSSIIMNTNKVRTDEPLHFVPSSPNSSRTERYLPKNARISLSTLLLFFHEILSCALDIVFIFDGIKEGGGGEKISIGPQRTFASFALSRRFGVARANFVSHWKHRTDRKLQLNSTRYPEL